MSLPLPFRKPSARDRVRQEWIEERRREALLTGRQDEFQDCTPQLPQLPQLPASARG